MVALYSVILAGGVGTRLWPLSRTYYPKQFLQMNGGSLFQKTYERALMISDPENIFVVTNDLHQFLVRDQIEESGHTVQGSQILPEKEGKNTLPAITWAVHEIYSRDPDALVAVFPSDHMLEFSAMDEIKRATSLAASYLVTFGITPRGPHTGFGYIAPGEKKDNGFLVKEFKEKPDLPTAQRYVDAGYLWNSGMFLFSVRIFIDELKKYEPGIAEAFRSKDAYEKVPSLSIDYGLLEKSGKVAVVPLSAFWTDLGTFSAWYDVAKKDSDGNSGEAECIQSSGNFISTGEKVTALVGICDTIVVDTDDALLVCRRDMAEKVGDLVKSLKKKNNAITEIHRKVFRPWGSYLELETSGMFKIKRITVKPGHRLSLQRHHHRSEHWIVVHGMADVTLGETQRFIRSGESTYVPAGVIHRLGNSGKIPLEVIEVQIGEYLEEDDIERTQDDYART